MVARSRGSRPPEPGPCAVDEGAGIKWDAGLDGRFLFFPGVWPCGCGAASETEQKERG